MASDIKDMSRSVLEAEVNILRSSINFVMERVAEVVALGVEKDTYIQDLKDRKQSMSDYNQKEIKKLQGKLNKIRDFITE